MHSVTLKTPQLLTNFNQMKPPNQNPSKSQFKSLKCNPNSNHNFINRSPILTSPSSQINRIVKTQFLNQPNSGPNLAKPMNQSPIFRKPSSQIERNIETHFLNQHNSSPKLTEPGPQINKIQFLSSEFKALPEPIDRVKRLLHYASLLSPIHEPGRVESNRVTGCTTQVWLEAEIDPKGLMRFRADSDSEITKGFCYCLVWALSGAAPAAVLAVAAEDLAEMNVGFSGRSKHSRVNTWQNVLVGMQRRTEVLAEERERVGGFPNLLVKIQDFSENEVYRAY